MSEVTPMSRGCGIYGCPNEPVVTVRIVGDDGTWDVKLCELDRSAFDEGDIGMVVKSDEL